MSEKNIERAIQIKKLQQNLSSIRKIAGWTAETLGEKIDISKNEELYYSTLDYYRKINSESGYWNNNNNSDEEAYIFLKKQLRKKTKLMKQK